MQMYTYFYKDRDGRPAFTVDSFYDVLSGKIPAEKYRDKIVLIGPTAAGVGSTSVTPIAPAMAPVLTLAHAVSSILQEDFFVSPPWAWVAQKLAFLLVAVYLIVLLPRLNAGPAAAVTATLLLALIAAHFGLMVARGTWVQLMVPATLLLVGHLALVTKRFIVTERAKSLRRLSTLKDFRFRRRFLGRELEAVVIDKSEKGAEVLTGNFVSVRVPSCPAPERTLVRVSIRRVLPRRTEGEIVP